MTPCVIIGKFVLRFRGRVYPVRLIFLLLNLVILGPFSENLADVIWQDGIFFTSRVLGLHLSYCFN
jgi:hypothetical protein